MSDEPASSVGKWLAGIAGSVVTAVLIWQATRPGGWFNKKPDMNPSSGPITVEGMVIDAASNKVIPQAEISLEISDIPALSNRDHTDSNGSYLFYISPAQAKLPLRAHLKVTATGYRLYDHILPLNGQQTQEIVQLESLPPPVGIPGVFNPHAEVPPGVVHPASVAPAYIRRTNAVWVGPPAGERH